MNDAVSLILMFVCGVIIGIVYFSGLWFTVLQIQHGKNPVSWLLTSLILRMSLLLTAFYFILTYGHWLHLLAALAGVIVCRIFSTYRTRHLLSISDNLKEKQL